jgi:hypothetical protein
MNNKKFIRYLNQNGGNAPSTTSNEIKIKHLDSLLLSESDSELPFTNSSLHNVLNYNDPNNDGGGIIALVNAASSMSKAVKNMDKGATSMKKRASDIANSVSSKASSVHTSVQQGVNKVKDKARKTVKNATDAVSNIHDVASEALRNKKQGAFKIAASSIVKVVERSNNETITLISNFINLQEYAFSTPVIECNTTTLIFKLNNNGLPEDTKTAINRLLTFINNQTNDFKKTVCQNITPKLQNGGELILINNKSRKSRKTHKKNN